MVDTNLSSPVSPGVHEQRPSATVPRDGRVADGSEPSPAVPLAALSAVVRRYGKTVALDGLDLDIAAGEIVALLGPNGAGKTTAVNLLLGLARPDAGGVAVLGGDPRQLAVRRSIGAMLQAGAVPQTLRVREHLELAAAWYGDPLPLAEVVRLAGLEGLEERLYGRLSGGQQRRVLFAMAICGAPRLLVLDEPTVALDVEARRGLWARVRELAAAGTAVLLTTHDLAEAAALASRVVVLHRGRTVANGTPAAVAALVAQRRVSCRTTVASEVVAGWPEAAHVEVLAGRLVIAAHVGAGGTGAEDLVRRLLAADPGLCELEVSGASLEDALLALTGVAAEAAGPAGSERSGNPDNGSRSDDLREGPSLDRPENRSNHRSHQKGVAA